MSWLFPLLLFVLFLAVVLCLLAEGMWSNAIRFINVVFAALLATNFWEPTARLLEKMNKGGSYWWDFVALWVLFAVIVTLLQTITNTISRVNVRFLAIANKAGGIELDASIMDGRELKAGAVAAVKTVRNPIMAARLVMEESEHVMMVGPNAELFIKQNGGAVADVSYYLHGGQNFSGVPLPDVMSILAADDNIDPERTGISASGQVSSRVISTIFL